MSAGKTSRPRNRPVSDEEVRTLLDRYRCPVQFHAVRTRFHGSISSPVRAVSPMDAVAGLWGRELPVDGPDGTDELLRVLVMGLWNELALLQERNAPLRLMRIHIPATREGLARISLIRKEEVIGFIQGLFGGEKSIALSKRTCRALEAL